MAWGSSFDAVVGPMQEQSKSLDQELGLHATDIMLHGTSFTKVTFENDELKREPIKAEKVYTNLKPTHDPYTNHNAQIYYECGCGAILDPGTKRFAELNNCASNAGWKIRFTDNGYVPYCVECGKGVE